MEQANKGMLGPNGEKLKIIINEPSKNDKCGADDATKISVVSKKYRRGNATNYTSKFNCSNITHEVLHLLGLCDEYKEPVVGSYVNSKTGENG